MEEQYGTGAASGTSTALRGICDECGQTAPLTAHVDPESPLTEVASALRVVNDLRPRLLELESALAELQERAPEYRRSWLTGRPGP